MVEDGVVSVRDIESRSGGSGEEIGGTKEINLKGLRLRNYSAVFLRSGKINLKYLSADFLI